MNILLKSQRTKLLANHQASQRGETDHPPVVKLFNPTGAATWLFTELDEDGILFGLCDLGMGAPELGYQSLDELELVRGRYGLGIERDRHWAANKTIGEYASEARVLGRIAA